MSLIWNNKITVSYFGEPYDSAIGINIDNLPFGEYIDTDEIIKFMERLYPKSTGAKKGVLPSPRIISGIHNNYTTGMPLCAIIQNTEKASINENNISPRTRTGHADYTGNVRYKGYNDISGLATYNEYYMAPLCFAGAVAGQILERRGIYTGGHIAQIHTSKDNLYDPVNITRDGIISIHRKDFPVINDRKGWNMIEDISKAKNSGETLGGIVECAVINVPTGVGSPVFNGLKNNISSLIFGIPQVNGIEFGLGFSAAGIIGSSNKDKFYTDKNGYTFAETNNHGGIVGSVSSGMPITMRVSFSPSDKGKTGTYDTCFVPSAVLCVESAVNIALLSNMIDYPNFCLR